MPPPLKRFTVVLRWILFIPLAAVAEVFLAALWAYVCDGTILDRSYWEASVYSIIQPLIFLSVGVWIAPVKHSAIPIILTVIVMLTYGAGEYEYVRAVSSGLHSWNERAPVSGITLRSTLWMTALGFAFCTYYCICKIAEYKYKSLLLQRINLGIAIALFFVNWILWGIVIPGYSQLPNGELVDNIGRIMEPAPFWAAMLGEGHYWYGLAWFLTERIMFWGSVGLLVAWFKRLSAASEDIRYDTAPYHDDYPQENEVEA